MAKKYYGTDTLSEYGVFPICGDYAAEDNRTPHKVHQGAITLAKLWRDRYYMLAEATKPTGHFLEWHNVALESILTQDGETYLKELFIRLLTPEY